MSCGVSSRSAVVICSRCIQHAVPKHETSKWNSQISLSIVFSGSAGLKRHISDGRMFNWCAPFPWQANPPPVVVNADNIDTPPYVSALTYVINCNKATWDFSLHLK